MFIRLLCVNAVDFKDSYDKVQFTIEEGDEVNAMISKYGIHFEYKKGHYSLPYRFEDVAKDFISAFDKETYDKIYKKVNNCMMYFEDGTVFEIGDARVKVV
jgi:hypothetical protein